MQTEHEPAPSLSDAQQRSLNEDLHGLARDARAYAEAELKFQKTRMSYVASASKSVFVLGLAALVMVFFAIMALVVGLVIALGPWLTPWGSMAAVTLALLAIAVVLLLKAKTRIAVIMSVLGQENPS